MIFLLITLNFMISYEFASDALIPKCRWSKSLWWRDIESSGRPRRRQRLVHCQHSQRVHAAADRPGHWRPCHPIGNILPGQNRPEELAALRILIHRALLCITRFIIPTLKGIQTFT